MGVWLCNVFANSYDTKVVVIGSVAYVRTKNVGLPIARKTDPFCGPAAVLLPALPPEEGAAAAGDAADDDGAPLAAEGAAFPARATSVTVATATIRADALQTSRIFTTSTPATHAW
jgi:hypothetical protein